jgi:tripartite ATP-independent transporter DctM subunit
VREVGSAFWGGIWAILFPVFLLLGLRFGIFTPSEIGAFAVLYAILIGVLAYRRLRRANAKEALDGSMADIGAVMFLIAMSAIFSYGIVFERIPELVSATMLDVTRNPYLILALIVVFLIFAGMLVDGSILIIMLTPIFLPVAQALDVDPVHFGVIFVLAATISNFTPPVGSAMYAVCSIMRCPVSEYTRESIPFFVAVSGVTLLLILLPSVVLFVPNWIFGAF